MRWYLATNEIDVFHYGTIEEEWEITTGQPNLFFYNSKEELIAILESYEQQYQEPTIVENLILEDTPQEPPLPE